MTQIAKEIRSQDAGICACLRMCADVFGPSRCLAQFASVGILPRKFVCERIGEDEVIVSFEFDASEDTQTINRALAKLSVLPVMR